MCFHSFAICHNREGKSLLLFNNTFTVYLSNASLNIDNLKLIDETVEIPLGQNTLRVEAVNVDSMITTKELEVKGVRRPVVSLKLEGSEFSSEISKLLLISIVCSASSFQ